MAILVVLIPWAAPEVRAWEVRFLFVCLVLTDLILITNMHGFTQVEIVGYPLVVLFFLLSQSFLVETETQLPALLAAFSAWRFVHSRIWGHLVLAGTLTARQIAVLAVAYRQKRVTANIQN